MLKKLIVAATVLAAGTGLLYGTKPGSYVRAVINRGTETLDENIPPEVELVRIRTAIKDMDGEIDKARAALAKTRVVADELKSELADKKTIAERDLARVQEFGKEIKAASDETKLTWKGRSMPKAEALEVLAGEAGRVKTLQKEVENRTKMLAIRERTRDILEKQVTALVQKKSEVTAEIAAVESDIELAKLEQTESKYQSNGTALAEVKASLKNLRHKVAVERETLNLAKDIDLETGRTHSGRSVEEILSILESKSDRKQ